MICVDQTLVIIIIDHPFFRGFHFHGSVKPTIDGYSRIQQVTSGISPDSSKSTNGCVVNDHVVLLGIVLLFWGDTSHVLFGTNGYRIKRVNDGNIADIANNTCYCSASSVLLLPYSRRCWWSTNINNFDLNQLYKLL